MARNDFFSVSVEVKRKTDEALLVVDENGNEVWVPFSQISVSSEIDGESDVGAEGKLWVPEWLAEDRGWK